MASEGEDSMTQAVELCNKIREIYPEIGDCGADVDVFFDEEAKAWVVKLNRGGKSLRTLLEPADINACIEGKQCLSIGAQLSQLVGV
jgi:hypothetical protein